MYRLFYIFPIVLFLFVGWSVPSFAQQGSAKKSQVDKKTANTEEEEQAEEVENEDENDQDQSRLDNAYVETDPSYFNDKNKDQNNAFLNHESPFPGRPKDQWEASIKVGGLLMESQVGTLPSELAYGFLAGVAVRKSLGYVVSLRGEYNYRLSNNERFEFAQHVFFADAVFSLTNVNFHLAEPQHNIYLFAGPGFGVNATNVKKYGSLTADYVSDYTQLMASAGIGYNQRFSRFSLGADLRFALPLGKTPQPPQEEQKLYTSNYVTLAFTFNMPLPSRNRVEPLWWKNPLVYAYSELNIPKHQKTFKVRFKDNDEDGVADDFDQEPNTRKGCPVNPLGITLDTDKDGVPDCDDLEPITPTRCQPVNDDGIGKCPEPIINQSNFSSNFASDTVLPGFPQKQMRWKDSDGDGVPDVADIEPNTPKECPVDTKGKLLDTDQDGVPDCYDMEVVTPTYCFPVNEHGIGNCLTSNCCEGLKFKDPKKYDKYRDSLGNKERTIDSLQRLLDKDVEKLKGKLNKSGDGQVEVAKDGKVNISLNNDIFFESGRAELKPGVMPLLTEVAKVINDHPEYSILVEGHTDNVPIRSRWFKDNWDLSTARSSAVVRVLTEKFKINPERLSSVGRGEFAPIADNATPEGRARNRRIEIRLLLKK